MNDGISSSAKHWCRMAVNNCLEYTFPDEYDSDQTSYRVEVEGRETRGDAEYRIFLVHLENELQAGMPLGIYRVRRRVEDEHDFRRRWLYEGPYDADDI